MHHKERMGAHHGVLLDCIVSWFCVVYQNLPLYFLNLCCNIVCDFALGIFDVHSLSVILTYLSGKPAEEHFL